MNGNITPPGDDFQIRCPRLGHAIPFSYCRSESMGLPCFKTLDCWFEHFPVADYLQEALSREEWVRAFHGAGKNKVMSLLELIEQARRK